MRDEWRPVMTIYWPEQFWCAVIIMFAVVKFGLQDPLQDWVAAALIAVASYYRED
jgi:hypothetical protein